MTSFTRWKSLGNFTVNIYIVHILRKCMVMILKYILTNKSKKVRKSINVTHGFVSTCQDILKQEKKIFNFIKLIIKIKS